MVMMGSDENGWAWLVLVDASSARYWLINQSTAPCLRTVWSPRTAKAIKEWGEAQSQAQRAWCLTHLSCLKIVLELRHHHLFSLSKISLPRTKLACAWVKCHSEGTDPLNPNHGFSSTGFCLAISFRFNSEDTLQESTRNMVFKHACRTLAVAFKSYNGQIVSQICDTTCSRIVIRIPSQLLWRRAWPCQTEGNVAIWKSLELEGTFKLESAEAWLHSANMCCWSMWNCYCAVHREPTVLQRHWRMWMHADLFPCTFHGCSANVPLVSCKVAKKPAISNKSGRIVIEQRMYAGNDADCFCSGGS